MDYYARSLSGERLRACYRLAPPRVRRYLRAEIDFVLRRIAHDARVLELGCGYGRILGDLAGRTPHVVGIDTSHDSLRLARRIVGQSCLVVQMNAVALGFRDDAFDVVICIQNGISAFHVDPHRLVAETIRVTRRRGRVLLSSYAERFWPDRLRWFRIQSEHGLIGEIDEEATRDGTIVCRDGFTAGTFGRRDFAQLLAPWGITPRVEEVDRSSLFCEFVVP